MDPSLLDEEGSDCLQRAGQGNVRVRRQPCIHRCAVMGRRVAAQVRRSRSSCSLLRPSRLLGVSLAWADVASGLSKCRATAIAIERATSTKRSEVSFSRETKSKPGRVVFSSKAAVSLIGGPFVHLKDCQPLMLLLRLLL